MQFPVPGGCLSDGRIASGKEARCYLIRVADKSCSQCRRDHDKYSQLVDAAIRVGCRSVSLSPAASLKPEPIASGSEPVLASVDLEFGRALTPLFTPQTVLLNSARRVLWEADGAMDGHALDAGLRALRAIR